MKRFLQSLFLFSFAFGVATMTKHYGLATWIENNPVVSFPMMVVGGIGILIFFGEER